MFRQNFQLFAASLALFTSAGLSAQTFTVTNGNDVGAGSLRQAILDSNLNTEEPNTISIDAGVGTVMVVSSLPQINHQVEIVPMGNLTISGNGAMPRAFYVDVDAPVTIGAPGIALDIINMQIKGGNGGNSAGGGMGAGGGLFVRRGQVELIGVTFGDVHAIGGDGGGVSVNNSGGGGGGGLGGNGGSSGESSGGGGGGGYEGDGGTCIVLLSGGGGGGGHYNGGISSDGAGGGGGGQTGAGGDNGGGGGGSSLGIWDGINPAANGGDGFSGAGGGAGDIGGDGMDGFLDGGDSGAGTSGGTFPGGGGSTGSAGAGGGGGAFGMGGFGGEGGDGSSNTNIGNIGGGGGGGGGSSTGLIGGDGGDGGFGAGGGGGGYCHDSESGSGGDGQIDLTQPGGGGGGGGGGDNPIAENEGGFGGRGGVNGGGGGGGAGNEDAGAGGDGGHGGGGGGAGSSILGTFGQLGGFGGFGGGGGGPGFGFDLVDGADGGFGGGGGAGLEAGATGGASDFGGGTGASGISAMPAQGGGAGAAFGGAVFVEEGAEVIFTNPTFQANNSVTPGTSGPGAGVAIALGDDLFMMSGSTTTFNITGSLIINKAIESDQEAVGGSGGGLIKQGIGILTLNAVNTYTGTTTVSVGTLAVNGSIVTSNQTIVAKDATLQGTGTVANCLVNGTLHPGNSIGTINIVGTYTQGSGSTLNVEVDSLGNASLVNVTGDGNIDPNATLSILAQPGSYNSAQQYLIINTTAGLTGTFDTLLVLNPSVLHGGTFDTLYNGTQLLLLFAPVSPASFTTPFHTSALAVQQIWINDSLLTTQLDSIGEMDPCCCERKTCCIRPFVRIDYANGKIEKTHSSIRTDLAGWGIYGGGDVFFKENYLIGLAGGYLQGKAEKNEERLNTYALAIYARADWCCNQWIVDGYLSWLWSDYSFCKENVHGHPDGKSIEGRIRLSYGWYCGPWNIKPQIGLVGGSLRLDSIKQDLFGSTLKFSRNEPNFLDGEIAVVAAYLWCCGCFTVLPEVKAAYLYDFLGDNDKVKVLDNGELVIGLDIDNINRHQGYVRAGFSIGKENCAKVGLFYEGIFGHRYHSNGFNLGLSASF